MDNINKQKKYIDLSPISDLSNYENQHFIIYVVKLEDNISKLFRIEAIGIPNEWIIEQKDIFKTDGYIKCSDSSTRIFEEIVRRIKKIMTELGDNPDLIVISTPGTIQDNSIIARASRLGILKSFDVTRYLSDSLHLKSLVLRDTDARAAGEIYFGDHEEACSVISDNHDFAVVMIGPGVGMTLVQNWSITNGAGAAGAIGRLVIEPHGPFNDFYNQRGNLETCTAIPWISRAIVEEYLMLKDKLEGEEKINELLEMQIKAAIKNGEWKKINYDVICSSLETHDTIVESVMTRAAKYIASTISAIIAINNPKLIILAGEAVEKSNSFFEIIKKEARKLSWGKAWERTSISKANSDKEYEILGASYVGFKLLLEK